MSSKYQSTLVSKNLIGYDEVMKWLDAGYKIPAAKLSKAVKAGSNIAKQYAKADAPVKTGLLKRSIRMKLEKRKANKKVYQIYFANGDLLAKIGKNGKRSFYPASQEYGWKLQNGKKHIPAKAGYYRNAVEKNRSRIANTIMQAISVELNKLP